MGIELYWDNDEQTIMLCEFVGDWTWSDMYETLNKVKKVTDKSQTTVGAIIDVTRGVSFPGGSIFSREAFNHAKNMVKMGEGGTGPIVIAGASPLIRTAYQQFAQINRGAVAHIRFADSLDEARRMMAEMMREYQPQSA